MTSDAPAIRPASRPTKRVPQERTAGDPALPRGPRRRAILGFALIVASVGVVYAQRAQRIASTPDDAGLALAHDIVAAELRQGDGMAFLPAWSASQRWRFAKLWREAGMDFSALNPLGDPIDPWDLDGLRRLWVLTTHGRDEGLRPAHLGTLLRHERLGAHMALLLIEMRPSRTVFDFRRELLQARLERETDKGAAQVCEARAGKLSCPGQWWRDVFEGVNEVGNSRRRCIFVQPHPDRGVTRLSWRELPAARRLEGRFGNRLWAVRHDAGSAVELRILVGGRERHRMSVAPGDFTYHRFGFDLDPEDRGQPIHFELRAEDTAWRQTCLDARLIGTVQTP